jgi:hypothetical protein
VYRWDDRSKIQEVREEGLPWRGCVYPGGWAEDVGG